MLLFFISLIKPELPLSSESLPQNETPPSSESLPPSDIPLANTISMLPASFDSGTPQSPPTTTLIRNVDLLRCTRHIHGNISILAGSLGIASANLQEIKCEYEEVETQAYWVLKKWQKTTSNAHRDDLHDVLQTLGFHKAAERYLCLLYV